MSTVTTAEKVRENRLRRKLDRMWYRLVKSRARDPDHLAFGGYQILNIETGGVEAGWGNAGRGYAMTLGEVEAWVRR
jgi:nitrogenase subunit NifH